MKNILRNVALPAALVALFVGLAVSVQAHGIGRFGTGGTGGTMKVYSCAQAGLTASCSGESPAQLLAFQNFSDNLGAAGYFYVATVPGPSLDGALLTGYVIYQAP